MAPETLIIGAGIAGLSCARALSDAGAAVRLVEKSRGLGGRCATRRVVGQPVDHGVPFLHGDDIGFHAAVRGCGPGVQEGWPRRVVGDGAPCRPRAYGGRETRFALADGISSFAKRLAAGIDVVRNSRIVDLESEGGSIRATADDDRAFEAESVVLALPAVQVVELLESLPPRDRSPLASIVHLLRSTSSARCLTVIAAYPPGTPSPDWEMAYPEDSSILQTVVHDSSKRPDPERTILVLQAPPRWSREHWEADVQDWRDAILAEAGRLYGDWAARPDVAQTHRWRYAYLTSGGNLTSPVLVQLDNGARLGFAGEAFAPDGGVQAAWQTGRQLAERLMGDDGS